MPSPLCALPTRRAPSLLDIPAALRRSPSTNLCLLRATGRGEPTYLPTPAASTSGRAHGAAESTRCRWLPGVLAAVVVLSASSSAPGLLRASMPPLPDDATFENVPQMLSGGAGEARKKRIQKPKSREAERCTSKCVGTCIQGGAGSPGEGPFNVRRPLVVFKSGFRSRNYWLQSWGIHMENGGCLLCNEGLDSNNHIFFKCSFSQSILVVVCSNIIIPKYNRFDQYFGALLSHDKRSITIICAATFFIWNRRLHCKGELMPTSLYYCVLRILFSHLSVSSTTFVSCP